MPLNMNRRPALLGATIATTLLLVIGAGVALSRLGHGEPAAARTVASDADIDTAGVPAAAPAPPEAELAAEPSADQAPTEAAPPSAASDDAAPTEAPSTETEVAPPPPPPAPAPIAPGQRVNPTSAEVQAAVNALHGRIPLFSPTDQQLRTFADAVCTSFDNGMSHAQVQSTVQQAVSHIQGASLSAADADFAVRTVAELRCPGYV